MMATVLPSQQAEVRVVVVEDVLVSHGRAEATRPSPRATQVRAGSAQDAVGRPRSGASRSRSACAHRLLLGGGQPGDQPRRCATSPACAPTSRRSVSRNAKSIALDLDVLDEARPPRAAPRSGPVAPRRTAPARRAGGGSARPRAVSDLARPPRTTRLSLGARPGGEREPAARPQDAAALAQRSVSGSAISMKPQRHSTASSDRRLEVDRLRVDLLEAHVVQAELLARAAAPG